MFVDYILKFSSLAISLLESQFKTDAQNTFNLIKSTNLLAIANIGIVKVDI